jgi:hypothetical protein
MRLETAHGTYVVIGENNKILHLPEPTDQYFPSVWSVAPPPTPAPGLREVEIGEGPLAPSTMVVLEDGFVAFRRDQVYLCAVPAVAELRFEPGQVGPWERFAISEMDGAVVRQPVVSHAIPDAPWIKKHGIDFIAASTPSCGQMPITIAGSTSGVPISYLEIEPYGRFGNNIYQIINAYWMSKSLKFRTIVLNRFDFISESVGHGVEIRLAKNFKNFQKLGLRGHFFGPNGFEEIFRTTNQSKNELRRVINMLGATYSNLTARARKKKSIAMHFRSGDVFTGVGHIFYVQPPASYYIKCFNHANQKDNYDLIELVYEDRKNPAIEIVEGALAARGIAFASRSATVEDDICRLLSADCIISSCGSFCEGISYLSKYLKKYYCFRTPSSQEFWHPFSQCWTASLISVKGADLYICDEFEPGYISPRSWSNSVEQRDAIRLFPENRLRIYRY